MRGRATSSIPRLSTQLRVRTLSVTVVDGVDRGMQSVGAGDRLTVGTASGTDLTLSDPTVSRYHAELQALDDGVLLIDHGSTNGTYFGEARLERARLPPGAAIRVGRSMLQIGGGARDIVPLHPDDTLGALRGRTAIMRRLMARVHKVAASEVAVLLVGETGTGKELIAHALHDESPRAGKPFVTVDCGAITPSLVASELFGHERGAFTGADRQHIGAFERAAGGTLFLDEVGELPVDLQASLLGVLERRVIHRVGGSDNIAIDARIVSATNRDLRGEVNAGTFRQDLYYRLAVVHFHVPALRQRSEDIPLLIDHFLRECGASRSVESVFPGHVLERFGRHPWPGNIRELRNVVEATLVTGEPVRLHPTAPPEGGEPSGEVARLSADLTGPYKHARGELLAAFERAYLTRLLEHAEGNVSKASRVAQMTRLHLFELLRKHGLR